MKLLLDLGNSRLKWGIERDDDVRFQGSLDYRSEDFVEQIRQTWQRFDQPGTLAVSSVGGHQPVEKLLRLAQQLWPDIVIIRASSSRHACGVTNAYRQAEKLGVDRWLNLLAMHHYYPGAACVIDCGTAITVDFLNRQGQHLGGLISPGLRLMKRSLQRGTAQLPFSEQDKVAGLAADTEAAIYNGTLYAAAGLVEHVLSRQQLSGDVIMTGGDASLIAENLSIKTIIEPDMVLKGLSVYCKKGCRL
ncbi:type III pantothenate kinase [Methylomarinum sp. Ch1-1]|uniref:Type III pantothenate kinase n=1 Tax=Methylomarinum roseum TaxID=3067653 RepID=A0AAU7NS98_9GAMM|nr:type III pantothenate kinase [Methylomarinum sp. Ch1-1]MDP4520498.1 type III pantothenate kinase [Methylomarinum sp. Ch1-1]